MTKYINQVKSNIIINMCSKDKINVMDLASGKG